MTISFKSMDENLLKISPVRSGGAKLHVFSGRPADAALPPIVYLHAGVCDSRMWRGQLDAFSSTRRVVAFDRRGFGKTLPVDERYSNVDDLWAVMDDRDIDRAVLVGCSQGDASPSMPRSHRLRVLPVWLSSPPRSAVRPMPRSMIRVRAL